MKLFVCSVIALLFSCTNPVKQPDIANLYVTIRGLHDNTDSVIVQISLTNQPIRTILLEKLANDTTILVNGLNKGTDYSISIKAFLSDELQFTGFSNFQINGEPEYYLQIYFLPELHQSGDCWSSSLQCDTLNKKYRLTWENFPDSQYFQSARMVYWLVMDTVMIPEDINIGLQNRVNTIYFDNYLPDNVEYPIKNESRAYFRLFVFSETYLLYLQDCQTLLFQVRSGI